MSTSFAQQSKPFKRTNDQPVLFRDPSDVRLHQRHATVILTLVFLLFVSIGVNFYQYLRKPDLIVAVTNEAGTRVVQLNNRDYGATDPVQIMPDKPTDGDKKYLSAQFTKLMYSIDPATRPKDIEAALHLLLPEQAVKYAKYLKESGTLDTQRDERWQSVWVQHDISIDRADPYIVHLIGEQQVTKVVNNQMQRENIQLALDFKLVADLPRADRNLRTGFLIGAFAGKELARASVPVN